MIFTDEKIQKSPRRYFSKDFEVEKWEVVETELEELKAQEINSTEDLSQFIEKVSELRNIIEEVEVYKYRAMTCYADDPKNAEEFNRFYEEVMSRADKYYFDMNKKIVESEYSKDLDENRYSHLIKLLSNDIRIFREENIELGVEENKLSNKYGEAFSKLSTEFDGEERTLVQLSKYLKDPDREKREQAWRKSMELIGGIDKEMNDLFDEMKELRIKKAENAEFENYRDYMHMEKSRFDYTPEDIKDFHNSVETVVVPFLKELSEKRKEKLGVDILRPWDTAVDLDGKVLKPFETIEEFTDKAIKILGKIDAEFGRRLEMMKNSDLLDLGNRKGKAPGGYNASLPEQGASFIFMNAVGLQTNVSTLLHESGHAMHSYHTSKEPVYQYRSVPSEIAELASMSMELMTLDKLNEYYSNEEDLNKAKREQLEGTLSFLPWCMIVDEFQQWIYTNVNHTKEERDAYFVSLMDRFNTGVDWSGLEEERKNRWLKQLHIFEVPFYYIEYGISQLGALAIYKNYKENGQRAIDQYKNFLSAGYSKSMREIYEEAGIKFDFSQEYIKEMVDFVKEELEALK